MTVDGVGGAPMKFKTPEELDESIQEYFSTECGSKVLKDEEGNVVCNGVGMPVYEQNPPTISGLAYWLGFESRQSIHDYIKRYKDNEEKKSFAYITKRAILQIERYVEKLMVVGQGGAGAIFWMKNHGWTDKQEIEHSGGLDNKVQVYLPDNKRGNEDE